MLQAGPLIRQTFDFVLWFICDSGGATNQVSTECQLQSSSAHQSLPVLT